MLARGFFCPWFLLREHCCNIRTVCVFFRFLKAKLASCQAQLKEALQAHQASQQEAVELRSQVSIES